MRHRLESIALWALLALPLSISPLLGLLTPYVTLVLVIPVFFVTIYQRRFAAAYSSYTARAFLAVFLLFALLFTLTADSVSDALRAFNFTMVLAYG